MTRTSNRLAPGLALMGALAAAPAVYAHATYNLSGYGAGVPGSVGSDGSPTAIPPATWANGGVEGYAGGLPVMWYAGMHAAAQARTMQTGAGANPPNGSLLQQVNAHNAANDPDLPTDRVLAVGGKSWSDPDNDNQGWGHGLDYGLIHFEPVSEVLAGGPVGFTITLADDPTDGVAPQLAFALYGGWDTNPASVRHQTFVTSPTPVNDPLGSSGLRLLDFAVATGPGRTISRTYDLDAAYDGRYTIFVAALGGVSGQYQLTVATAPNTGLAQCQADLAICNTTPGECQQALGACTASLSGAQTELETMTTARNAALASLTAATADADGDGRPDRDDACAATPAGAGVDQAGCSLTQFCERIGARTRAAHRACIAADWRNDEPVMRKKARDCTVAKATRSCVPAL